MKTRVEIEMRSELATPSLLRPLGNVRYVAPSEPEPDPGEWEFRKTSKKGNRVYVRKPVTLETVRKLTLEVLSQLKPEIKDIVVRVADRPAVGMDGKVHDKFAKILDLAAQRMEILMVGPAGCGKSHLAEQVARATPTFRSVSGTSAAGRPSASFAAWSRPGSSPRPRPCGRQAGTPRRSSINWSAAGRRTSA